MLDQPQNYIEPFAQAGADLVSTRRAGVWTFQIPCKKIKSLGKKAGIVLNPDTPVEEVFLT